MRKLFNLSTQPAASLENMSSGARQAVGRVAGTLGSAARQLGDTGHELLAAQQRLAAASREAVRRHPFSSVAIAVGLGVLLSRLSGR